jgi:hypothetical protein
VTRDGILVAATVAAISALACAGAAVGCSTTDGSFRIDDPGARPSSYCEATDLFPPALTRLSGVLLDVLLFAGPTIGVVVFTVVSKRRGCTTLPRRAGIAIVAAIATLVIDLFAAHVGYQGHL